jgi:hypothetical protein
MAAVAGGTGARYFTGGMAMRVILIGVVLAAGASLLSAGDDDGNVSFAKGYPKAGPKPGQILVKGMAKPQTGFTLRSASAQVWPEGGGEAKTFKVQLNKDGTFGETIVPGLDSGSSYHVVVDVAESRDGHQQVRRTGVEVVTVR